MITQSLKGINLESHRNSVSKSQSKLRSSNVKRIPRNGDICSFLESFMTFQIIGMDSNLPCTGLWISIPNHTVFTILLENCWLLLNYFTIYMTSTTYAVVIIQYVWAATRINRFCKNRRNQLIVYWYVCLLITIQLLVRYIFEISMGAFVFFWLVNWIMWLQNSSLGHRLKHNGANTDTYSFRLNAFLTCVLHHPLSKKPISNENV